VGIQLHATADLPLKEDTPPSNENEAGWFQEPVWTLSRSLSFAISRSTFPPVVQPVEYSLAIPSHFAVVWDSFNFCIVHNILA